MAFGIGGFLVQLFSAPLAIAIDAATYLVSAVLLGTIRRAEPPPPPREAREPVRAEIRAGIRLVRHDPILRAFAGAQMALAAVWGILGATWFLFVLDDLSLGPAVLGIIAGLGGFSSFIGAVVAGRATTRWGIGPVAIGGVALSVAGNALIPLAPVGLPLVALGCLVLQQLVADSAETVYDITETTVQPTSSGWGGNTGAASPPRSGWRRWPRSSWPPSAPASWPRSSVCGRRCGWRP